MLETIINNLSDFLLFNRSIIPNIITLVVYTIVSILALKGGGDWITLIVVYLVVSLFLSLLGISSVFNVVDSLIDLIIDLINPFTVIRG